jgi:hypothetical protein
MKKDNKKKTVPQISPDRQRTQDMIKSLQEAAESMQRTTEIHKSNAESLRRIVAVLKQRETNQREIKRAAYTKYWRDRLGNEQTDFIVPKSLYVQIAYGEN